jgi:hypothetical protein
MWCAAQRGAGRNVALGATWRWAQREAGAMHGQGRPEKTGAGAAPGADCCSRLIVDLSPPYRAAHLNLCATLCDG